MKLNDGHFSGTVTIHFLDKTYQEITFKSHLNSVLRKNTVGFTYVPCGFVSFYLFVLFFVIKLKSANYKSH